MNEESKSNIVYVVFNINGDVIGVADSYEQAKIIFSEKHGDLHPTIYISKFELNKFYYA
jgi:hypothetical protein